MEERILLPYSVILAWMQLNILLRHLISRCNTFAVLNYSRENISRGQNSFAWPIVCAVYD